MADVELPSGEELLASAVRYLIDGQEEDAASVLLACSLDVWESGDTWYVGDERHIALHVSAVGPRSAYEILADGRRPITLAVRRALQAVLPERTYIKHFTARAQRINIELDPEWRSELLEIARGTGVHNQALSAAKARHWNHLRFRSESEVRIAQALERARVLFLPNCVARLTSLAGRVNREADFLVCHEGKWGILEVDGEPFHPPSRTAQDHERDRLFRAHGVRVVEHFDANECFEAPDKVVERFLEILKRS